MRRVGGWGEGRRGGGQEGEGGDGGRVWGERGRGRGVVENVCVGWRGEGREGGRGGCFGAVMTCWHGC
jgi:hypothetical protein